MPNPILEAAAQALADGGYLGCYCCWPTHAIHGDGTLCPDPGNCDTRDDCWAPGEREGLTHEHIAAAAVLAAARPLIETETRERIARAIEAMGAVYAGGPDSRDLCAEAARIARGDNTGHEQEPAQ
jgi:hypothetical protein